MLVLIVRAVKQGRQARSCNAAMSLRKFLAERPAPPHRWVRSRCRRSIENESTVTGVTVDLDEDEE